MNLVCTLSHPSCSETKLDTHELLCVEPDSAARAPMSSRCVPCAVPADDVLKAGWLTKRAVSAWRPFKNWRHRFVVLTADTLSWHETEDTSQRRGSLPIRTHTTVRLDGLNLIIDTKGRTLILTGSESLLGAWQRAVNFVVNHAEEEGIGVAPRSSTSIITSRKDTTSIASRSDTPRCVECAVDEPAPDVCGICLGTIGDEEQGAADAPIKLRRCSHTFCMPCLATHIETQRKAARPAWCPICRRPVDIFDVLSVCDRESCGLGEGEEAEAVRVPETMEQRREREHSARKAQRDFEKMAARLHMRKCPHCAVPIIKNGGCNNMTCRGGCGRSFQWNRAPTVVPCRQVHLRSTGPKLWCEVCRGAHPIAYVKLAGARALVIVLGVPVAASGLALGLAVGAGLGGLALVVSGVPLLLVGPLALLYSPFHAAAERRREAEVSRKNAATLATWRSHCAKMRWAHLRALGAAGLVRAIRNADAAALLGKLKGFNVWYAINANPAYYYNTHTKHVQWHRPSAPNSSVKWVTSDGGVPIDSCRENSGKRWRQRAGPLTKAMQSSSSSSAGPSSNPSVFGEDGVPLPPLARSCIPDGIPGIRKGDALPRRPILSRFSRNPSALETAAFSGARAVGSILTHVFDDD